MRQFRWFDYVIMNMAKCLPTDGKRPCPQSPQENPSPVLSQAQKKHSAALMRINHVGEVCAQALYLGQSLTARNPQLRVSFAKAAEEEADHLHWCEQRLTELGSHKSYLNPLWFTGSLVIGTCAGLMGDGFSLGFLAETERQVMKHLENHLIQLPLHDSKSRAIVKQMHQDEAKHATTAIELGGKDLPAPVQIGMRWMSKVMVGIAYYA